MLSRHSLHRNSSRQIPIRPKLHAIPALPPRPRPRSDGAGRKVRRPGNAPRAATKCLTEPSKLERFCWRAQATLGRRSCGGGETNCTDRWQFFVRFTFDLGDARSSSGQKKLVLYADWDGCAFRRLPALCKHEARDSQTCRREGQTNLSDLVSGVQSIPILEWGLRFEHHSKLSSGLSPCFSSPFSFPQICIPHSNMVVSIPLFNL